MLITIEIFFFSNIDRNGEVNKDVLNTYNEREGAIENFAATYDKNESDVKMNESLDNLENSQNEEALEQNIWSSESIQQLIEEVNTDHQNVIKWAKEIAKTTNKSNSDRLITELLLELKRNLSIVANLMKNEDVASLLVEIAREGSFKKREELKYILLKRLDAPHNAIGNVKLFAELYNIELLDYEEMIKIMNIFLEPESINHATIECFCEFMCRVGCKMDNEYHCQFVYYVAKLKHISTNGALGINNRIRCIVENCLNRNFYQNH